jgi:hypothetical protein
VARVGIREEQVKLALAKLGSHALELLTHLLGQLRVALGKLRELDQVVSAAFQLVPGRDELTVLEGFARQFAGRRRVVPRPGSG